MPSLKPVPHREKSGHKVAPGWPQPLHGASIPVFDPRQINDPGVQEAPA